MPAGVVELDEPRDPRRATLESELVDAVRAHRRGHDAELQDHLERALALLRGRDGRGRDHALRARVDATTAAANGERAFS